MMSQNIKLNFSPNPDFERIGKVLRLEMPDRVPIAELDVDNVIKSQFLGKKIETIADEVEFWYQAGYDYAGVRVVYQANNLFPGALEAAVGHAPPPIQKLEDVKNYPWKRMEELDFTILDDAAKALKPGMKIITGEGSFFDYCWQLMGLPLFCMEWAEETRFAKAILDRVCEIVLAINKKVIDHPAVGAMWIGDDIAFGTGTFMSPDWFRNHIFPCYKEIGDLCKKKGKPFIFHSDGYLFQVMDDLIDAGINAIHPLEHTSMDITEVKKRFGKRITLIGNIDLIHTLPYGTKEEIYAEVSERIKTVGYNGGYIVSSANSIPPSIPIENYVAMLNAVREYGHYPVN
jgi:uroporphyrinogen decarboxylase